MMIVFLLILVAALIGVVLLSNVGYLLTTLIAAARPRRPAQDAPAMEASTRFVVLVPAHDEELVLASTLASLRVQNYPQDQYEVVVVADNCSDTTADIAREGGATVLERLDAQRQGKGYALDWAITHLLARPYPADAVVIVDADTWVAPDFLAHAALGLAAGTDPQGQCALQGRYGVLNSEDGWRASLMAAAFELFNHIKPLGCDRLGLSVSLRGNGMIFSRALLERAHWRGDSVTEDLDFGMDLVSKYGVRVGYLPEARVWAQMPVTAAQATSQRERWEGGRYRLVRDRALPLLAAGLKMRSPLMVDAALNLLLLPLAELGALWLLWSALIAAGALSHRLPTPLCWAILSGIIGLGLLAYVFGGLRVAKASRRAYSALLCAPFYAAWKLWLYVSRFGSRRSQGTSNATEWIRTDRMTVSDAPDGARRGEKAA